MVQLWVLIGLIISATAISALGAAFSIVGLGKLFAGAMLAVWAMAGALELSKFVIAAFLHQTWKNLNFFFKTYLFIAVVVLSMITSMGIFGFLSDAYQESTTILEAETIKLESLKADQARLQKEADRLNQSIEEIPATRITRKMQARAEAAPLLQKIAEESDQIAKRITEASLKVLEVKGKIGPLIYISKAFNVDVDTVVKYLILLFVAVFDPLAICLVVAVSESIKVRKEFKDQALRNPPSVEMSAPPAVAPAPAVMTAAPAAMAPAVSPAPVMPIAPAQNTALVIQVPMMTDPEPVVPDAPFVEASAAPVQIQEAVPAEPPVQAQVSAPEESTVQTQESVPLEVPVVESAASDATTILADDSHAAGEDSELRSQLKMRFSKSDSDEEAG